MIPQQKLNIVITGGTRGLGLSLTKKFVQDGNNVVFTSRKMQNIHQAIKIIDPDKKHGEKISGYKCDASKVSDWNKFQKHLSKTNFKHIDVWINNAGESNGWGKFIDMNPDSISQVITSNLLGTILGTHCGINLILSHNDGKMGHVFNINGNGSSGGASPYYSIYGSTKSGITQFTKTMMLEMESNNVGIHIISPGMMITQLLLHKTPSNYKKIFNIMCETPDTVANFLTPIIYLTVQKKIRCKTIKYLTVMKIIKRLFLFSLTNHKFFDRNGEIILSNINKSDDTWKF